LLVLGLPGASAFLTGNPGSEPSGNLAVDVAHEARTADEGSERWGSPCAPWRAAALATTDLRVRAPSPRRGAVGAWSLAEEARCGAHRWHRAPAVRGEPPAAHRPGSGGLVREHDFRRASTGSV